MRFSAICLLLSLGALAACDDKPVEPKTQAAVAMPATGLPETAAQREQHWWTCGDVAVSTELQGEMLMLSGPFGERSLPAQNAASGALYADGKGNEFWNKGEEATLKLDWKDVGECKENKAS
jgi:membrane-bound inhibitor of C-type lysozyme